MTEPGVDQAKIERQIELERSWIDKGIKDYYEVREKSSEAHLKPGLRLMISLMKPTIEGIREFKNGTNIKQKEIRDFLHEFKEEEIAFITVQACIDSIALGREIGGRTNLAVRIAERLETKLNYDRLLTYAKTRTGEDYEKAIALYREYHLKRWKTRVFLKREGIEIKELTIDQKIKIGGHLIYIFANQTEEIEVNKFKRSGDEHSTYYIQPSENLLKELESQHYGCALLNTTLRPMIVPPKLWTGKIDGGYLTNESNTVFEKVWLVRHQDPEGCQIDEAIECPRECMECGKDYGDPKACYGCSVWKNQKPGIPEFLPLEHDQRVYDAINAVQSTAWRVNRIVYKVISEVWWNLKGGEEWNLPYREDKPLPPCPKCSKPKGKKHPCFEDEQVKKEWSREAAPVYQQNDKNRIKRTAMRKKLDIAKEFLDESEIYFPHSFDFRGRMYPLPVFVNPQADDTGRALLEFAIGKLVRGDDAVKWYKVSGANHFGKDKLPLADRVKWIESKEHKIRKVAKDPITYQWWLKADDCWQFLAFCCDYAAWLKDPENHESRLPVAVDGKCNGLQWYASLLRDEDLGKRVSLTASTETESPGDVYQDVADIVSELVKADAEEGNQIAKLWLHKDGRSKVERKIVKKAVMNFPYGITDFKVWDEIVEAVEEIERKSKKTLIEIPDHLKDEIKYSDAITYLRMIITTATKNLAASAGRVMWWLKAMACIPNFHNHYGWLSPAGFNVSHIYHVDIDPPPVKVKPLGGIKTERFSYKLRTFRVDKKKMRQKMPPNFVHSLDSSHLMNTVITCKKAGIDSFGMVHDSYASHAADVPLMSRILREEFVSLHKRDILIEFREDLKGFIDVVEEVEEEEVIDWGDGTFSVAPNSLEHVDPEGYIQEIESKALEEYLGHIKKKAPELYLKERNLKHLLERGDLDIEEVLDSVYFFS
jgi:DNA-directed RNA polymerase